MVLPGLLAALVAVTTAAGYRATTADRAQVVRGRFRAHPVAGSAPLWFSSLLRFAEVPIDPERVWAPVRIGGALALVVAVTLAPVLAVAVALVLAAGWRTAPVVQRRRAAAEFEAALPSSIDHLVGQLASGSSLLQAMQGAAEQGGPVAAELGTVVARHQRGTGVQAALDQWAHDRPGTGVGLVADALALSGSSGGSQAGALEGVGATLRERQSLMREVRALGSQARTSALVLVATPVAFATVVAVVDPRIGHLLVGTPLGWVCIATGCLLDGAGACWMARLLGAVR